ncbi:hypothetical protein MWJ18_001453 [Campylobacter lari]|nr:hypothetical protein [Campylobacter lari]EAH7781098.1 hypothetical protein [Campylobacter lari]EAH8420759.1 hypothetical protein [Campylobacter lari]EAI0904442.1 hypothetical protein [Campylobacter lari]EAI2357842.1 hypothetical protein [Campylobacter lari]
MLNFILDLSFYEVESLFFLLGIPIALIILFYRTRILYINISISCLVAMLFTTIIFFISAKPDEKFINSLKENNIINQETLSAYLSNDDYSIYSSINTLGFGICKRNNYNGETCHDYLRYVISSLKTKQEELKKEHQENLKKEQEKLQEKQKEQIKLKEKNENIENLINDYSKN